MLVMRSSTWTRAALAIMALSAFLLGSGCDADEECSCLEPRANPEVTLEVGAATASISQPAAVTIRIENTGDERIVWGSGSSSCRLFAQVVVDGAEYLIPAVAPICTGDIVSYHLDPGEVDSQTWMFDARIWQDANLVELPPGHYDIVGVAGQHRSDPKTIEVVADGALRANPDSP